MSLPCPRCRVPLLQRHVANRAIYGCGRCAGTWLDSEAAWRIAEALDPETRGVLGRLAQSGAAAVQLAQTIHCPICSQPLARYQATVQRIELE